MNIGDLTIRVLGDTSPLIGDIEKVGASPSADKAGQTFGQKFGRAVGGAIQRNAANIGTAVGAVAAEGINAAAQFKDLIATIDTVAGDGKAEAIGLDKALLDLSKTSGKTIEDLAQGAYDLVSAGVPAEQAMSVLAASTNLAIGGLGSTADAVDAVTTAMNSYGQGTYTATQITDVFAEAVAAGKVTTAGIGQSLSAVAPIAAQAGIGIEEIGASYARMTASGVPASEVTQNMRQAIVALISPNEQLNTIQARTGINFAQLARDKGLAVSLDKLREVTGAAGDTFGEFSTQLATAGSNQSQVTSIVAKFQHQLGLTDKQAQDFITSVGDKGMAQSLNDLAHQVGAGDAAFADSLGRVQAYQFALLSTGENAASFAAEVQKGTEQLNNGGLAAEQAAIKMKSPVEAGKRLAAQFKALEIEVFGPFADSLGPGIVALNQIGGAMGALVKPATLVGGLIGRVAGAIIGKIPFLAGASAQAGAATGTAMGGAAATAEVATESAGVAAGQDVVATKALPAATKGGTKMGTAMGLALKVAMVAGAALAWVEVLNTYNDQKAQLALQSQGIGADVAKEIVSGTNAELTSSQNALETGMNALATQAASGNILAIDSLKATVAQYNAVTTELNQRFAASGMSAEEWQRSLVVPPEQVAALRASVTDAGNAVATMGDTFRQAAPAITTAAKVTTAGVIAELVKMGPEARAAGVKTLVEYASGIRDHRAAVKAQINQLNDDIKNKMTRGAEIAYLTAQLTGTKIANGLKSSDPVVKAQAEATRAIIEDRLIELGVKQDDLGKKAQDKLKAALKSKDPEIKAQAERTKALITGALAPTSEDRQAGRDVVSETQKGLADRSSVLGYQAYRMGVDIAKQILRGLKGSGFTASAPVIGTGGVVISGQKIDNIGSYAGGVTDFAGGLAYVHQGEVLANLPAGTDVIPRNEVATMMGGGLHIGSLSIPVDARGQGDPEAIGQRVRQGVADAMADVMRKERARLPSGASA